MPKILLIDDNQEILSVNSEYLSRKGFDVTCADTGIKAIVLLNQKMFDCIVLDILLPDLDGYAICKAARTVTDTPIIFLSCLEEADDKIKGFMSGGDDYMTKPCSLKELAVRINAIIRRNGSNANGKSQVVFFVDRDTKIINALGKSIPLSEREFNLFMLLYENKGIIFTKEVLLDKIWGGNAEISAVTSLVLRLRRKIEFAEGIIGQITSEYGKGYCLELPEKEKAV
jgi:DNA-binding response OmpR family regulator